MGNPEKFKPTQPGANNSFVEPALLSRHDELAWLFHPVRLKSAGFAMQAGVSEICVYQEKGATRGKGAEAPVHTRGWPAGTPSSAAALAVLGAAGLLHRASVCSSAKWEWCC